MSRLKLWTFVGLVVVAGGANLAFVARWVTERALAQIERELRAAAAQVDARSQLLAADAAQLAEAVARAPAVVQALLAEGEGAAAAATEAAEQSASRVAAEPGRALLVATSGTAGRTVRVQGGPAVGLDPQAEATVWGAAGDGVRREGYALAGDGLFYVVAVPAGRGTSVAVGVPVTAAWLSGVRAATGCDATLVIDGKPWRSSLAPAAAALVASAGSAVPAGRAVDAGRLEPQPVGAWGVTLPPLLVAAPAHRIQTVGLKGLPRGLLALSQATAGLVGPVVAYAWLIVVGLAVVLLAGLILGRAPEPRAGAAGETTSPGEPPPPEPGSLSSRP